VRAVQQAGFEVQATRYLKAPMDAVGNAGLAAFLRHTLFAGHSTRVPVLSTSVFVRARRR
jgi:hypothetical protein